MSGLISKNKILCIVGESGTGKTTIADYIEQEYGIPMILSYTDRPKRHPNEGGHTFITSDEFDQIKYDEMLAFTDQWVPYRYCCLHSDVYEANTYVIDESGVRMLKDRNKDRYDVKVLRVFRDKTKRLQQVDKGRIERDKGNFTMPIDSFDYVIINDGSQIDLFNEVDKIVEEFLK